MYHRWDGVLLEAFQQAADNFVKNGYTDDSIPIMYVGTKEGIHAKFQTEISIDRNNFKKCNNYDPRIRPWYTRFVARTDRQIAFAIDRSSSVTHDLINGEMSSYYTQRLIDKIIRSLDNFDEVRFFAFGTNVTEIHPPGAASCLFYPSKYMIDIVSSKLTDIFQRMETGELTLSYIGPVLENLIYQTHWGDNKKKIVIIFTDQQYADKRENIRMGDFT